MNVRDVAWTDFREWADLYFLRYDEVERNPDLGLYLQERKPTLGEEAALFGQLMREIAEGDLIVAVAEEDGRLVGAGHVGRRGRHREERHIGVLGLGVHPDRRGRGVGDALLTYLLERCRGRFEIVELRVVANNAPARHLYEKHGFREFGTQPRSFHRGDRYLDDALMWRPVEPP